MILKNLTKNLIITKDLKIVESLEDSLLGLLKKTNPRSLLFITRFGVHTFFLKESIDILVLDKNFKVVRAKENLKPNKIFLWNPKHFYIIELPIGKIRASNIEPGDALKYIP